MRRYNEPLVSIIIPTYNRSALLVRAIESALRQTYPRVEIVIVDDASTDETPQVVQPFLRHPGVRYHRNEKNLGLVGNWRKGFELAQGAFCSFLCDDDLLDPRFVEKLLKPLLKDVKGGLSFSSFQLIDLSDTFLPERTKERIRFHHQDTLKAGKVKDVLKTVVHDWSVIISATLFRRSAIRCSWFDEAITGCIDFWLVYQCIRAGYSMYFVPLPLAYLRENPTSVSRNTRWRGYMLQGKTVLLRRLLRDPFCASYHTLIQQDLTRTITSYGNTLLIEGKLQPARTILREAMCYRCTTRSVVGYALSLLGGMAIPLASFLRQASEYLSML